MLEALDWQVRIATTPLGHNEPDQYFEGLFSQGVEWAISRVLIGWDTRWERCEEPLIDLHRYFMTLVSIEYKVGGVEHLFPQDTRFGNPISLLTLYAFLRQVGSEKSQEILLVLSMLTPDLVRDITQAEEGRSHFALLVSEPSRKPKLCRIDDPAWEGDGSYSPPRSEISPSDDSPENDGDFEPSILESAMEVEEVERREKESISALRRAKFFLLLSIVGVLLAFANLLGWI